MVVLFSINAATSAGLSWADRTAIADRGDGVIALMLLPFVTCMSAFKLVQESDQCQLEGFNAYSRSIWHWIECLGLALQLASDGLWLSASSPRVTTIVLAWGVFVTILKSLHFARGFEQCGSFVHTIQHVIYDMGGFVLVLSVLLCAFGVLWHVLNIELIGLGSSLDALGSSLLHTIDTALYGRGLHPFEGYEEQLNDAQMYPEEVRDVIDATDANPGRQVEHHRKGHA